MKIKNIQIKSIEGDTALTEIMFEIASARAEKIELLRFDLDDRVEGYSKLLSFVIRKLKNMKQRGQIQFFALDDSFERNSTEAVFLLNKYPEYFENIQVNEPKGYIYVKI